MPYMYVGYPGVPDRTARHLASVRVSLVYTRVTTYDELRNLCTVVDFSARLVSFYIRPSSDLTAVPNLSGNRRS